MNRIKFMLNATALFALLLTCSSLTHAQATRTFVSAVGDDANPCIRVSPCKTFAGAMSRTAEGGEIDALDPGGYGAVNITKAITIDGGTGSGWASILASGISGVTVSVTTNPTTAVVTLRNLSITGAVCTNGACSGTNAIRYTAGSALHVQNCILENFNTTGIDVSLSAAGSLWVQDTNFSNTATGIRTASTSVVVMQVEHCRFQGMTDGINANTNTFATVRDSYFGGITGTTNGAVKASSGCTINVANSTFSNNGLAVRTLAGGTIRISNNEFFNNTTAINNAGTVATANNNKQAGNTTLGTTNGTISSF
ncbi:MAG: hypothetical protein WBP93_10865 [Pyrinomonadaceae bacterium]